MDKLFETTTFECSRIITKRYSTSFSMGIRVLHPRFHNPIYAIYGFVRYADEIVDTFRGSNKEELLHKFKTDTYEAINGKISLNPVLHSFQNVVNQYNIPLPLIASFFESMGMDLQINRYDDQSYEKYIYGSAEVVGLMCLNVFCENNKTQYNNLTHAARKLGAAFQKVNFIRDIGEDYKERGRVYFPHLKITHLSEEAKLQIVNDIEQDFKEAKRGILNLPAGCRAGVYLAYAYYVLLFKKIKRSSIQNILTGRIRIADPIKIFLMLQVYLKYKLNLL